MGTPTLRRSGALRLPLDHRHAVTARRPAADIGARSGLHCMWPTRQRGLARSVATAKSQPHSDATSQAYPLHGYYMLLKPVGLVHDTHKTGSSSFSRSDDGNAKTAGGTSATRTTETHDLSPQERARIVFGSRLASPGYTSSRYRPASAGGSAGAPPMMINGVRVPPRPLEPDNCCMSGCVNCVWDNYRDDLEDWAKQVKKAKARAQRGPRTQAGASATPPSDSHETSTSHSSPSTTPQLASKTPTNAPAATSVDLKGHDDRHSSPADQDADADANANAEPEPSLDSNDEADMYGQIPVGIREFMRTEKRLKEKHRAAS